MYENSLSLSTQKFNGHEVFVIYGTIITCTYLSIGTYTVFSGSGFAAQLFVSFPVGAWAQPHLGQMSRGREGEEVLAAEGTDRVDTNDDDDNDDGGYNKGG